MRPLWKDVLAALWLGMILPGIVLNVFVLKERQSIHHNSEASAAQTEVSNGQTISVKDPDGMNVHLEMDKYLTGVLLAEMPAQFHPEALKAQAVAARTYTWKAYTTGGKHGDRSVCMDSTCCQAYLSEETYYSQGGTPEDYDKIRRAVETSSPFVLAYNGELIEATYFSSSAGMTEAALAVWGTDFPYLQAVSSPETVSVDMAVYTKSEFEELLGIALSENPLEWFGNITYTEGGGVATMEIGGDTHTGVELRRLLGLRSTVFELQLEGQNILITTRGYGHRVGMSQYGAEAMAQSGSSWQTILQHYYPGTTLFPAY